MLNIDRSHTDVVIEILQLRVNTILLHVLISLIFNSEENKRVFHKHFIRKQIY